MNTRLPPAPPGWQWAPVGSHDGPPEGYLRLIRELEPRRAITVSTANVLSELAALEVLTCTLIEVLKHEKRSECHVCCCEGNCHKKE